MLTLVKFGLFSVVLLLPLFLSMSYFGIIDLVFSALLCSVGIVLIFIAILMQDIRNRYGAITIGVAFMAHFALIFVPTTFVFGMTQVSFFGGIDLLEQEDKSYFLQAIILIMGGGLSFFVGRHLAQKRRLHNFCSGVIQIKSSQFRGAPIVFLAFFLLGFTVFSFFISGQGGWSAFNESNSTWRALGVSGSGLFIFPSTTLLMFASVPTLVNVAVKLKGVARFIVYAVIMFTVAIPALIFGFRIVLIPYLLIGVWVWHQYAQRIMVGRLVMGALVGIILLTGYGYLRDVSEGQMSIFDYWANGFLMRTNGAEVLTQVIKKSDNGIPHGVGVHSALEALTILVPRNMVEWKPVPFSEVFSELYFADYFLVRSGPDAIPSGISPTVLGQLFHEFGAIGCLLFMGLFGYVVGIVDSLGRQSTMLTILLYGVTLRFFLLLPESPQGAMSGAVIDIFAVFLVLSALRLLGGFVASREQERVPRLHKESDVCQLTT